MTHPNEDSSLSLAEKMQLIKGIELMQSERWNRMKMFHGMDHISMKNRHFFMSKEIQLMREQRERLNVLKSSLQK